MSRILGIGARGRSSCSDTASDLASAGGHCDRQPVLGRRRLRRIAGSYGYGYNSGYAGYGYSSGYSGYGYAPGVVAARGYGIPYARPYGYAPAYGYGYGYPRNGYGYGYNRGFRPFRRW